MLDIKFIRDNLKKVEENNRSRKTKVDLKKLVELDDERKKLQTEIEALRAERKKISKTKPTEVEIAEMRELGNKLAKMEETFRFTEQEIKILLISIPNINHETTPIGPDESGNVVERQVGKLPKFKFQPKEHFEIENVKPLLDLERGAKVSGSRFYYLRGKLALLERAILQYAVDLTVKKGFELVLPPILVQEQAMYGTGFFPAEKNEIYSVNPGEDNLFLIGTSEVPLISMYGDETLEEVDLPKKYVSITPCFRREAGSYGKDTKGLIRVHQFYKVEMVVFAKPEDSWKIHNELLAHEEEILKNLGIPYQMVNICSGDMGFPAAKKYDCEGWFPGQGRYRELTSTSNTTDYQARRSNIKYKNKNGREYLHTLNGTVVSDRPLLAILENYQQADGSIKVPAVLKPYLGFDKI
jgi:seryl-tRNA synthetase